MSNYPIIIAHKVSEMLSKEGFSNSITWNAGEVFIGVQIAGKIQQTKIDQDLADKGAKYIFEELKRSIVRVN